MRRPVFAGRSGTVNLRGFRTRDDLQRDGGTWRIVRCVAYDEASA
jgi:hypothetical protein